MRVDGIHHITAITGNAQRNVDFYARVLGLRLVKKTVNQDEPTVYHLFYGDEHAQPGADLTFFEYPGAVRGQTGAGSVHRILWRVRDGDALAFWEQRLREEGTETQPGDDSLLFTDPEGLAHELVARDDGNEPLAAHWHEVPAEHALLGFAGARAYSVQPEASAEFLTDTMGFEEDGADAFRAAGARRSATWAYDHSTARRKLGGGSVHHIAWWTPDDEHESWVAHLAAGGAQPTPVIDRHYFRSIYCFEPSQVLFELATATPGFTVDEPLEHLGERLSLPPKFEPLRSELERVLEPVDNPRTAVRS